MYYRVHSLPPPGSAFGPYGDPRFARKRLAALRRKTMQNNGEDSGVAPINCADPGLFYLYTNIRAGYVLFG